MRVIVFDRELHEPLTVVDVPHWLAEQAKTGRQIRLLPQQKLSSPSAMLDEEIPEQMAPQIVTLTFEQVRRGSQRDAEHLFWFAYADDAETALLLRAAYLPGQVGDVQRREKMAYLNGLFSGAGLDR